MNYRDIKNLFSRVNSSTSRTEDNRRRRPSRRGQHGGIGPDRWPTPPGEARQRRYSEPNVTRTFSEDRESFEEGTLPRRRTAPEEKSGNSRRSHDYERGPRVSTRDTAHSDWRKREDTYRRSMPTYRTRAEQSPMRPHRPGTWPSSTDTDRQGRSDAYRDREKGRRASPRGRARAEESSSDPASRAWTEAGRRGMPPPIGSDTISGADAQPGDPEKTQPESDRDRARSSPFQTSPRASREQASGTQEERRRPPFPTHATSPSFDRAQTRGTARHRDGRRGEDAGTTPSYGRYSERPHHRGGGRDEDGHERPRRSPDGRAPGERERQSTYHDKPQRGYGASNTQTREEGTRAYGSGGYSGPTEPPLTDRGPRSRYRPGRDRQSSSQTFSRDDDAAPPIPPRPQQPRRAQTWQASGRSTHSTAGAAFDPKARDDDKDSDVASNADSEPPLSGEEKLDLYAKKMEEVELTGVSGIDLLVNQPVSEPFPSRDPQRDVERIREIGGEARRRGPVRTENGNTVYTTGEINTSTVKLNYNRSDTVSSRPGRFRRNETKATAGVVGQNPDLGWKVDYTRAQEYRDTGDYLSKETSRIAEISDGQEISHTDFSKRNDGRFESTSRSRSRPKSSA